MSATDEIGESFPCFGSSCTVLVTGEGEQRTAAEAVALAKRLLLEWHLSFSRFEPESELSRLNRDPRATVPVSPLLARLAEAVVRAGSLSGGLVDATLVEEIVAAGYAEDLAPGLPLGSALELVPPRSPAAPASAARWGQIEVDLAASTVTRPPGVMLDGGGLAKGMFADVLARELDTHEAFAVNCAGDLAIGGRGRTPRPVRVESPFDGGVLHTFAVRGGAVATSGIGRRSWRDRDGRAAHHLLDPSTGRPAYTGIVQVTALAPSALTAEIRAKAAILSGPRQARRWLPDGGVIVLDDATHVVLEPSPSIEVSELAAFARRAPKLLPADA
jgi:thiamine biosynthesis lipoprotein